MLSAGIGLASTPGAGRTFTLDQTANGGILLTRDQSTSWGVNKAPILGDLLLRVDEVIPGARDIHGSLAGSLVPQGNSPGPGVALCATF